MKTNVSRKKNTNTNLNTVERTHEGGVAKRIDAEKQLRRSVASCMLFESNFYESGEDVATRITNLVKRVDPNKVAALAVEAREQFKLRHVPLLVVSAMCESEKHKPFVSATLEKVVQRPDELTEMLAIWWKNGKRKIPAQMKKGLAKAFVKFNEYTLSKYNRDSAIKLRDVMFLTHPKPTSKEQEEVFKKLVENKLTTPDTWETELSAGKDKKATWERLMKEKKLGALAYLRNLRNMQSAGVSKTVIKKYTKEMDVTRVLPFRFIAAARFAPFMESELEQSLFTCVSSLPKMKGRTIVLIDVSGSMDDRLSEKSDMTRLDAACGVAMAARELVKDVSVYTFSTRLTEVPSRRGFALRDAISNSQNHAGTYLSEALRELNNKEEYDRLIIITDEQSADGSRTPKGKHNYMINVASYKNGVGYGSRWTHIDGFSESVLRYISEVEKEEVDEKSEK